MGLGTHANTTKLKKSKKYVLLPRKIKITIKFKTEYFSNIHNLHFLCWKKTYQPIIQYISLYDTAKISTWQKCKCLKSLIKNCIQIFKFHVTSKRQSKSSYANLLLIGAYKLWTQLRLQDHNLAVLRALSKTPARKTLTRPSASRFINSRDLIKFPRPNWRYFKFKRASGSLLAANLIDYHKKTIIWKLHRFSGRYITELSEKFLGKHKTLSNIYSSLFQLGEVLWPP